MSQETSLSSSDIAAAWQKFVHTGQIDSGIVRPVIAQSWIRSYQAGVNPRNGPSRLILTEKELQNLLKKHQDLIAIAKPFMAKLYQFVAGSGFMVLLSDERGFVMENIGDIETKIKAAELNLNQGACWAEEEVGTNGLGTALAIQKPVQISGQEHYCKQTQVWTCSAAPIFNEEREVIGALQISGPSSKTHLHTLGMVVAAVEAIENELRIKHQHRDLALLNNRLNNIFLTVSDGVIVVDRAGKINQVNPVAEKILTKNAQELEGTNIKELIDKTQRIKELLHKGSCYSDIELAVSVNGTTTYCLSTGKPIKDDQGRVTGGVIFIKPINKVKTLVNRFSGAQATFQFEDIIGNSKEILKAIHIASLAAENDSNVLLCGESGTGKEIFAQAIHNKSKRRDGPFVAVNCGAIPRELVGSELFGYEEGAFTGALKGGRPGKFELASGGTLFLDEIGDMPLEHQVALLRVLQDKYVTRIGSSKVSIVDVRIICATNQDLQLEVKKGNFRNDLYYRLNVISIKLPPLRDRVDDIPTLFDCFLKETSRKLGIQIDYVDPAVITYLQQYHWPGNVREFQNVVERMVNLARDNQIRPEYLPTEIYRPTQSTKQVEVSIPDKTSTKLGKKKLKELLAEKERQEIIALILRNRGNISQVARDMGISRTTLYRKMEKLNIS